MGSKTVRNKTSFKLFWLKLTHFEFWPYWVFYLPFIPYYLIKSIQHGSFCLFSNVNPSIYLSGIVGESKEEILSMIKPEYLPQSLYFDTHLHTIDEVIKTIEATIQYPLILKPDVGERGNLVEKIADTQKLKIYLENIQGKFIVQEFIDYPYEFGIMYYHIPNTDEYKITSIVEKGFLNVVGDGVSSIKSLLSKNDRALLVWDYLEEHLSDTWNSIPKKDELIYPQPIGNHCKGTMFIDSTHLTTDELTHKVHTMAKNIPEFYYGRFDVKAKSLEDFNRGDFIKVMELNGVTSEPGHIYDPNYSLITAYKDILNHFRIILKISKANTKRGFKPASFSEVYKLLSNFYSKS